MSSFMILMIATFVALVSSQTPSLYDASSLSCQCKNDNTGHWKTDGDLELADGRLYTISSSVRSIGGGSLGKSGCGICRNNWEGDNCDQSTSCIDSQGTDRCNGGTCVSGSCVCPNGFTGAFCESCIRSENANYFGSTCELYVCDTSVTCNNQGTCLTDGQQALLPATCGTAGYCGDDTPKCCAFYNPEASTTQGAQDSYQCVAPDATCCGPNVCPMGEKCVDAVLGQCCKDFEEVCEDPFAVSSLDCINPDQGESCCDGSRCASGRSCLKLPQSRVVSPPFDPFATPQRVSEEHCAEFPTIRASTVHSSFLIKVFFSCAVAFSMVQLCRHSEGLTIPQKIVGLSTIMASLVMVFHWHMWQYGIMVSVGTLTSLAAVAAWDERKGVMGAFGVQLMMLFVLSLQFGGYEGSRLLPQLIAGPIQCDFTGCKFNVGPFTAMNDGLPNFQLVGGGAAGQPFTPSLLQTLDSCADFHGGYYKKDKELIDPERFDENDPLNAYFGLCSYAWHVITFLATGVCVCGLLFLVVATWLALMDATASVSSDAEAPGRGGATKRGSNRISDSDAVEMDERPARSGGPPPPHSGGPPPHQSAGPELPPGWATHVDASTGGEYFYNADTDESTWTRPIA